MAQTASQRYPGSSRRGSSGPGTFARGPLGEPGGRGRAPPKPLPPLSKPTSLPRIPLPAVAAGLGRFLPLVGVALSLWELWKLWEELQISLGAGGQGAWQGPYGTCTQGSNVWGLAASNNCAQWLSLAGKPAGPAFDGVGWWTVGFFVTYEPNLFGFLGPHVKDGVYYLQPGGAGLNPTTPFQSAPQALPLPRVEPHDDPHFVPRFIPQADPWAAPPPNEMFAPSPGYNPVPYEYVPYLPSVSPAGEPIRGPVPGPRTRPQRNPFRPPIVKPIPTRRVRPNRTPTPWVRPRGPWDVPAPDPSEPRELPRPRWKPRHDPTGEPDEEVDQTPAPSEGGEPTDGAPPRTINIPASRWEIPARGPTRYNPEGYHRAVPPKRYTKEKKGPVRYPFKFVNPATEACDVINSVYKALPRKVRDLYGHKDADCTKYEGGGRVVSDKTKEARKNKDRKRAAKGRRPVDPAKREAAAQRHEARRAAFRRTLPNWLKPKDPCKPELSCQAKAGIIYRELDRLNPDVALRNLAKDNLVDLAIGVLSKGGIPLNEALGRPVGVGAGPAI